MCILETIVGIVQNYNNIIQRLYLREENLICQCVVKFCCRKNWKKYHALPKCYPFVKWAGGKSQLLSQIGNLIPKKFSRYFEPFLGGGAVFFYLICKKNLKFNGYLSDINCELINTYNAIKNNVDELILILQVHQKQFEKSPYEYYYKIRSRVKFSNTTNCGPIYIFKQNML